MEKKAEGGVYSIDGNNNRHLVTAGLERGLPRASCLGMEPKMFGLSQSAEIEMQEVANQVGGRLLDFSISQPSKSEIKVIPMSVYFSKNIPMELIIDSWHRSYMGDPSVHDN